MTMKNTKEIGNIKTIEKQETMSVGASIARLHSKEHATKKLEAIFIARKPQKDCLKHKQAGITLIALVITIIILLILSAVTINLTLGERGIFSTAKKAGENYQNIEEKELANLNNFEQEMQNTINETGNIGKTPTKPKEPTFSSKITSTNYGEYVNYPVSLGENSEKPEWRIFYNDGTYVYLIASHLLLSSQIPTETHIEGNTGKPYFAAWRNAPEYTPISDEVRKNYKMNWKKSTTNSNIRCVSELLDIKKWNKFVYNKANGGTKDLAEDAIGSPTLEMWVESWNEKGNITLYCDNTTECGYYVSTTSGGIEHTATGLSQSDDLYFPNVYPNYYWLASPYGENENLIVLVTCRGAVSSCSYNYGLDSTTDSSRSALRPLVRLKSTVSGKFVNGVWELD